MVTFSCASCGIQVRGSLKMAGYLNVVLCDGCLIRLGVRKFHPTNDRSIFYTPAHPLKQLSFWKKFWKIVIRFLRGKEQ